MLCNIHDDFIAVLCWSCSCLCIFCLFAAGPISFQFCLQCADLGFLFCNLITKWNGLLIQCFFLWRINRRHNQKPHHCNTDQYTDCNIRNRVNAGLFFDPGRHRLNNAFISKLVFNRFLLIFRRLLDTHRTFFSYFGKFMHVTDCLFICCIQSVYFPEYLSRTGILLGLNIKQCQKLVCLDVSRVCCYCFF